MATKVSFVFPIRLDAQTASLLDKLARKHDRSKASMIRTLIREAAESKLRPASQNVRR